MVHAMWMLVGLGFDKRPLRQINMLRVAQIIFRALHSLIFAERSARSLFAQNVMHGMQRAVRAQHDYPFFRLAVAEIANPPKRAGHFLVVNFVHSGHTHALTQEFVGLGISSVGEQHRVMVGPRVYPPPPKNFIRIDERGSRVDGKLQVISDGRHLYAPGHQTPNNQTGPKDANQPGYQRVVNTCFHRRSKVFSDFIPDAYLRSGYRAVQQIIYRRKVTSPLIRHTRKDQWRQRCGAHDHPRNFEIHAVRAHQQQTHQRSIHRVVPDKRGENAPTQHYDSGHDADNPYFDSARVTGLLWIRTVQKALGSLNSEIISRLNAGMSVGWRLLTKLPSSTTSLSTHFAPALRRSS